VVRLNDARPVWTRIDHFLGRRRHKMRHLLWREGVADIDDPHPGILIGREDQLRALERAGAIFMQIMRTEFRALLAVILLSRRRKGADLHRVRRLAHIEYPAALD